MSHFMPADDNVGQFVANMAKNTTALNVCVFCSSSLTVPEHYLSAASSIAEQLHYKSWSLVYGGGTRGLMGRLAQDLVRLSGPEAVHGIIPSALIRNERGLVTPDESAFGRTTVVETMHQRKQLMVKEADAFLVLPGGFGTMEEMFEIITWSQLGIHARPIVLYNIDGFFDDLLRFLDKAARQSFIQEGQLEILSVAATAEEVVRKICSYEPAKGRHLLDWKGE